MVKAKEVEFIKMENGKMDLPIGIARGQGCYRLLRTIGGKKYNFGSIHNLKLALKVNDNIGKLVADYRAELARKQSVEDMVNKLIVENSAVDMAVITSQFTRMAELIEKQNEEIKLLKQSNQLTHLLIEHSSAVDNRSFIERMLNR